MTGSALFAAGFLMGAVVTYLAILERFKGWWD